MGRKHKERVKTRECRDENIVASAKAVPSPHRWFKPLLCTSLAVLASVSLLYVSGNLNSPRHHEPPDIVRSPLRVSYKEAQRDVARRQEHINSLLEGISMPYSAGVIYDHNGLHVSDYISRSVSDIISITRMGAADVRNKIKIVGGDYADGRFSAVTLTVPLLHGQGRKIPTHVGRDFFEKDPVLSFSDEDRRNILAAHEGRHAQQASVGFGYLSPKEIDDGLFGGHIHPDVEYTIGEMDANYDALRRARRGEFALSSSYLDSTLSKYREDRSFLESALRTSPPLQRKFILNALQGTEAFNR